MTNAKRQVLILILALLIFVFFEGGFYNSYISKYLVKINLNNILETYATDGNKDCPVAVGNDLVIEKISFVETKTIRYEFHVPKYSKDSLYLQPYKEFLTEINIEDLENTKSLAKLRNNDVIFEYLYFDNRGEEMFNIRVLFNTPITVID